MQISRRRGRRLPALSLWLAAAVATAPAQADTRSSCFVVDMQGAPFYVTGDVFRQAALNATTNRVNAALAVVAVEPPAGATRCTGVDARIPAAAPTAANYYGYFSTKEKFFRLAIRNACGAANPGQYFSMDKAIYYRNCGGNYANYIFFWGLESNNPSACFGSDYPTMYAQANGNKKQPVTTDLMASAYTDQKFKADSKEAYALGNAMAAILISETARDYLVATENYMLVDLTGINKSSPELVIGGHCPRNTQQTCQNNNAVQNGLHPLAWGGAQGAMMTNGWGTNNGATSEFGQEFEATLITDWLRKRKPVASSNAGGCDDAGTVFANLPQNQQNFLLGFFAAVLPNFRN